ARIAQDIPLFAQIAPAGDPPLPDVVTESPNGSAVAFVGDQLVLSSTGALRELAPPPGRTLTKVLAAAPRPGGYVLAASGDSDSDPHLLVADSSLQIVGWSIDLLLGGESPSIDRVLMDPGGRPLAVVLGYNGQKVDDASRAFSAVVCGT